jgi:hypothetical protein
MKRIALLPVLAACLGVLMLCRPAVSAEAEPRVGLNIGNVPFSAPITAEDAAHLGLPGQADFTLKDIKAPYVLIESLNST